MLRELKLSRLIPPVTAFTLSLGTLISVGQAQTSETTPSPPTSVVAPRTSAAPTGAAENGSNIKGYDFEAVVKEWEKSISPLQTELESSFKVFTATVQEAGVLLEQGKTKEAMTKMNEAIKGVLVARDKVVQPMWDGQAFLNVQIGKVRERLAKAAPPGQEDEGVDKQTEATLDNIASEIVKESDPVRKKRLTVRYKAIRALAEVKSLAMRLTPDQRKLWLNVLRVLEESSLAHMQLLMRAEMMFAQLDATGAHLDDYQVLYKTLTGAIDLMKQVRKGDARSAIRRMSDFSLTVKGLSGNIESAVETLMQQLEVDLNQIQGEIDDDYDDVFGDGEIDLDAELNARIQSLDK